MTSIPTNAAAAVSPGPSWAADWPPISSKHKERLARPPMPDRQHSQGMLDEEEDTKDINTETVKREDIIRLLRDIRDDFARLKLLQSAFSFRVGDDVQTLEMKDSMAQARFEESNVLRIATENTIRENAKLAMREKQSEVLAASYANIGRAATPGRGKGSLFSLDLKENNAFKKLSPSYGYYHTTTTNSAKKGERKFCYSCGIKLANKMEQFDERCAGCVAKANGLSEMNKALENIVLKNVSPNVAANNSNTNNNASPLEEMDFASVFPESVGSRVYNDVPKLIVRAPEERDDEIELDDGSEYASTTASTLSDTVASEMPSSAPTSILSSDAGANTVEPLIVGSVPPEDDQYIQENVAVDETKGKERVIQKDDKSLQNFY